MTWRVALAQRADRDLRRLDRGVASRVVDALQRLADEGAGDVTRLRGSDQLRLRVGDWRVRFRYDYPALTIEVLRILPRGRAYRD